MMDALQLVLDNPITVTVIAAILAFARPVARALQRALIRRIDRAWPKSGGDEEKVRVTVQAVTASTPIITRGMVEKTVRRHKSIPSPASPAEGS